MSASLPMSFEVRGFFSISCPQRSPLGVFAFDVFPSWTALPEYLHTCMPPLYFPGLSLRSSLQRGLNTQSHSYHRDLLYCLQSCEFIDLFTFLLSLPFHTMKAGILLLLLINITPVPIASPGL